MKWYMHSCSDAAAGLTTDLVHGLGGKEAQKRLSFHGKNKLEEKKKTSFIVKFFMQFNDFMIIVLLAAAGVSFYVSRMRGENDYIDSIIILTIVVLNAILGLVQENRAEKSLEALKKMSAPTAKVVRDGKVSVIETENLTPGDLIVLETGDFVPADVRLVHSSNLKVEESALTGESVPVEKDADFIAKHELPLGDRINMAYSGSSVSFGRATALVCEIGMNTEMGKIAGMILSDEAPETPLQKRLNITGKMLGISALAICVIIFVIGIFRSQPVFEMFFTSIGLAVAAIPEGLPAIVTIMLAVGVRRMAKRGAIIRRLPAVETLGSASVICSDKTGTLTQNKMKVVEIYSSAGADGDDARRYILKLAALCNDSIINDSGEGTAEVIGDPTETALIHAAFKYKINKNEMDNKYRRVGDIPFESKRKLMSTIHGMPDGGYLTITKGAPDILLNKCSYFYDNGKAVKLSLNKREEILANNTEMADKALRVLAVAFKEDKNKPYKPSADNVECDLIFAGLIGMMDPPREEAKAAIATCKRAGIKPVMVTGDHVVTAMAIGRKLGLISPGDKAMTGEELNKTSQPELVKNIYNYSIFARVSPEHKVRIVKAFQERGAVVAMTGDGVNDAPALKSADIGCAMGITGTDVAKGAADMVLTDDNFATIVEAVKEGRGIYANIRKAVHFLLSSNIGEIITIFMAILLGWDTPLIAIHLLWVNLVTDSLPAIALGVDPPEADTMERKPIKSQGSLFSDGLGPRIALEGCMVGMLALLAFGIGVLFFDTGDSLLIGRTMCFATLSISQLVHAFNMRSDKSIFTVSIFENKQLVGSFFVGVIMQVSVISIPFLNNVFKVASLNMMQWLIVALLCLSPIAIVELEKFLARKSRKPAVNYEQ